MDVALAPQRLFTGDRFLEGHCVVVRGGRVQAVLPRGDLPPGLRPRDLDGLLAPGFVDVQVNGGGGVLFNDSPTVEALETIGRAHRRFGTTGFLATLITDRPEVMSAALAVVAEARSAGVPGLLGIHLEGPFLSVERKGVHDPALIRAPTESDVAAIISARCGRVLVTVAPETVGDDTIATLVRGGVVVSLGHTAAPYERVSTALANGASGFTHLFNAMPPVSGRAPGPVGAALDHGDAWCGLIADLHHVHPAGLRLAIRTLRAGRAMLVTDAMSTVGTDMERFSLQGREVLRKDGRLVTSDGTLAGSDLDMASAVRNCVAVLGIDPGDALRMASLNPAAFLRLDGEVGRIAPGRRADMVLLDDGYRVAATWIDGAPDERA